MQYERILELLADGEWHGGDELRRLTLHPRLWVEELRASGHIVVESDGGLRLLRAPELLSR